MLIEQPRGDLWHLLATPQWYPRFFRGIGSTTKGFDPPSDKSASYSAHVGGDTIAVCDIKFRVQETRPGADLLIEGIESGWCCSVRLADDPDTGGTRMTGALFKISLAHPRLAEIDNSTITSWVRDGLIRAAEYLSNAPTAKVINSGELPLLHLSVAKKMFSTKIVDIAGALIRPGRSVRQAGSLMRWGFTLAGGYAAAQALTPSGVAIIDDSGKHSFDRIHHRSSWLAAGLADLGIREGATVGLLARNHAAMVEAMVACDKLGIDTVLINTGLSARQIDDIAARQQLAAVIVDDEFDSLVHNLPEGTIRIATRADTTIPWRVTLQELTGALNRALPRARRPGRQIVLTSGTSGTPKAAMRPLPKGFGTVAAMLSKLPLQINERMMIAAPLFHSWGLGLLQISTPVHATVVLQDKFDAETCLRGVARHRCTSLMVVPIMLQRLLDLPASVRARYDTSSLRVIASSGSPLPGSLATQVMDTFGDVLFNFYGSTEVSWATVADPTDLRIAPNTAGRPPLGTQLSVLGEDGNVVPIGAVGRIFVGNEMLFDGYTNATDPKVSGNLMDTGDLGYLDADGMLFVSGRDDEMIISGGENVFPRPVEDVLAMLPQIDEVAVIGVPDQEFGQRLAAFVVPHLDANLDVDMLRNYIRNRLNRFSVPRDITFLDELPRNATGKVLKRLLERGEFDLA